MKEIWKDISGYEEKYQISNLGRIKSLACKRWNGFTYANKKEQILKPRLNLKGYLHVCLYDGHKNYKDIEIQRLVAKAFISNPQKLPCVNHKDENPLNNKVSNLEWCDYKYNNNYGNHNLNLSNSKMSNPKHALISIMNGRKNSKAVIQFDLNGNKIHVYPSQMRAAKETNSMQDGISACCRGKQKTHNGYMWKFADIAVNSY